MQAFKTNQEIPEDRKLTLALPPDFPVGEAEVIVLAKTHEMNENRQRQSLEEFFQRLETLPITRRTKEEIDRYIQAERESWNG